MVVTKDINREVWRKAMAPAIEKYLQQFGREKIDTILNTK